MPGGVAWLLLLVSVVRTLERSGHVCVCVCVCVCVFREDWAQRGGGTRYLESRSFFVIHNHLFGSYTFVLLGSLLGR